MQEQILKIETQTKSLMQKAIEHLEVELSKIRAGRASGEMLDSVMVEYYGNPCPINQVSNISVLDSRTLSIQPWEKNMLSVIERAIMAANIGITPQNDGNQLRIFIPPLTEERRKEMTKKSTGEGENAKIAIRNIRRDAIEQTKKRLKEGLSEDLAKASEDAIQEITNKFIQTIDRLIIAKEKEIMSI